MISSTIPYNFRKKIAQFNVHDLIYGLKSVARYIHILPTKQTKLILKKEFNSIFSDKENFQNDIEFPILDF